jgi:hypothetical protein
MGYKCEYPGRNNYGLQYPFGKQKILLSVKIPVPRFSVFSSAFCFSLLSGYINISGTVFSYPVTNPFIIICPTNKIDPVTKNDPVEINIPLNILTTLSGG